MRPQILKLLFIYFTFFLSSLNAKTTYVENADDICYEKPTTSGFMCINMGICSGGLGCKNTYPLKNIGASTLSNVEAIYDESGLGGSFSSDCGVNPSGTCTSKSNINMGPFGMLGKTTVFDLANSIPPDDNSNSIWASNFTGMSCFNGANLYATYTKNGQQYRGVVQACPQDFKCANPKKFEKVYQTNGRTKLILAGNTNLCKRSNSNHSQCDANGASRSESNNGIFMINHDEDNDPSSTTNSSAANLIIPDSKEVLWAGLFWQGYMYNKDAAFKEKGRHIKYKKEGDSYQTVDNGDMHWVYLSSKSMYYQSYVDITDYVNTHKGGYYWVADIAASEGKPVGGSYGGWSIAVIYKDTNESYKNTTIFYGYQALANNKGVSEALSYANSNGCSTDTGVAHNVSSTISGFLTPQSGNVNASLVVFSGEGDTWGGGEHISVTDKSGNEHKLSNRLNPDGNVMNATISRNGAYVTDGKPHFSNNSLGIDIDTYNLTGILNNNQTSTDIRLTTDGDGYMPGMYAIESDLRVPAICYDYTYGQDGFYVTAPSIKPTVIEGTFNNSSPIDVKLYFKNLENSDVTLNNLQVHVHNIDTNEVQYKRQTTYITVPDTTEEKQIPDNGRDVGDNRNNEIPIGNLGGLEYFYTYYSLNHSHSDVNTTLNVKLTYSYSLNIDGTIINLGNQETDIADMNPCQGGSSYTPSPGRFNVVHTSQANSTLSSDYYFNLPTQVVKRYTDNYLVQSLDPNDLNTTKGAMGVVYLEMIDMSGFHYATATCTDHNATTLNTNKVLILFDSNSTEFVPVGKTDLQTNQFFDRATKNAAFRLSYNPDAINKERLILKKLSPGLYQIDNYADITGTQCDSSFVPTVNGSMEVDDYCSANGMNVPELTQCYSCVYGTNIRNECSRDNFAIRPEAFLLQLKDQNQTTSSNLLNINATGTNNTINLAAGYDYRLEINATNHIDNNPSKGYNAAFDNNQTNATMQLQYKWAPLQSVNNSACNDTSNKTIANGFDDGHFDHNSSLSQVGQYTLLVRDKEWTAVDYKYIDHHRSPYFNINTNADCIENSADAASSTASSLNGCQISSSHKNVDTNFVVTDKNVTFHPYEFNLNAVNPTVGLTDDANVTDTYIYIADISKNSDENMSFHLNGTIKAVGADGQQTTNFVNGCYAQPLQAKIEKGTINLPTAYRYRLHILDENSTQLREEVKDLNNSQTGISLPSSDFIKSAQGSVNTILNLNYDRKVSQAVNPELITFKTYKVACSIPTNCAYAADLNISNAAEGKKNLNYKIKHYYGRTHALRQRYFGPAGDAFIYYEVYCDVANDGNKSLLQDKFASKYSDDPRWFINTKHITARDGQVNTLNQKGYTVTSGSVRATTINTLTPTKAHLQYYDASTRGYPFKTTMEIDANNWLIYNKYDANATKNEFEVEFVNSSGNWAGAHETDSTTKKNAAEKTNRRLMW